jgi:hypothetical protein
MSGQSFTREALYKLVWSKPITQAAAELGVSDNGLAKICDRLQVPTPYRGYWAKVAAGKNPAKYRLQPPKGDVAREVTIDPTPPREPRAPSPVEAAIKTEAGPDAQPVIRVPQRLTNPHPIIAAWIEERRRRREELRNASWYTGSIKETDDDRRTYRLQDAIFKAIEKRGHSVQREHGMLMPVWLVINGERIDLSFRERIRQRREPLTPRGAEGPEQLRDEPSLPDRSRGDRQARAQRQESHSMGGEA